MARRRRRGTARPGNRYELLTCAWGGHALVGTDAAVVTPADAALVREAGGHRWARCLRCDDWVPVPVPDPPARERVPARDEIELPTRGPALRDKYVLRLIACDRAVHVTVLTLLALVLVTFAHHSAALHRDYLAIMNDLNGGDPGTSQVRGVLGIFRRAFTYSPHRLLVLALVVAAYAALEATEMVGLWLTRRWAEYLTFVATAVLVPYEVYELAVKVSAFKVVTFVINVAIVVYLLYAKRLFGLRGGHAVDVARRLEASGWPAIDRATPPSTAPADAPTGGPPAAT